MLPILMILALFVQAMMPIAAMAQEGERRPSVHCTFGPDPHHRWKVGNFNADVAKLTKRSAHTSLISWFAKCERSIRARGFEEKIFAGKNLSCLIHVVDADHVKVSILKSSGQVEIDQIALTAIKDCLPFSHPPNTNVNISDLKVEFAYPILEMSPLSGRLPMERTNPVQGYLEPRQNYVPRRMPRSPYDVENPQYILPDHFLRNYYRWSPVPKPFIRQR